MLKVQFGCGLCNPSGWLNYDSTPTLFFKKLPFSKPAASIMIRLLRGKSPRLTTNLKNVIHNKAIYGDIIKGLPCKDNSVDILYASHVLEHLPLKEFRKSLKECRRILKPGGTFRAVVPNLKYYIDQYLVNTSPTKSIEFCLTSGLGTEYYVNPISRALRGDAHHIMYDPETLDNELRCAGFKSVRQAFFGDSKIEDFSEVERQDAWIYPNCVGFECTN